MSSTRDLHDRAMELAEAANVARREGRLQRAEQLTEEAFRFEQAAAGRVASNKNAEPTRSVLHRSAATLAFNCNRLHDAEQLITTALDGNPPAEIAKELRDLLEQVHAKSLSANPRLEIEKAKDDWSLLLSVRGAAVWGIVLLNISLVAIVFVRASAPATFIVGLVNIILDIALLLVLLVQSVTMKTQLPEKNNSTDQKT